MISHSFFPPPSSRNILNRAVISAVPAPQWPRSSLLAPPNVNVNCSNSLSRTTPSFSSHTHHPALACHCLWHLCLVVVRPSHVVTPRPTSLTLSSSSSRPRHPNLACAASKPRSHLLDRPFLTTLSFPSFTCHLTSLAIICASLASRCPLQSRCHPHHPIPPNVTIASTPPIPRQHSHFCYAPPWSHPPSSALVVWSYHHSYFPNDIIVPVKSRYPNITRYHPCLPNLTIICLASQLYVEPSLSRPHRHFHCIPATPTTTIIFCASQPHIIICLPVLPHR
jgi:hypothetical protein